jgi:malate synthase
VIRYRNGVLNGRGASLLDGYMEDLATDRIYRLMIAQRMVHREVVAIAGASGEEVTHTPEFASRLFDEELARLLESPAPGRDLGGPETMREARRASEALIRNGWFSPV